MVDEDRKARIAEAMADASRRIDGLKAGLRLQAIHHDNEEYSAQQRALDAAGTGLRMSQAGYRAGETGLLQVLDAQRAYQRARIGQLRAKTAQYLDTAQLSVALGGHSDSALARRMARDNE